MKIEVQLTVILSGDIGDISGREAELLATKITQRLPTLDEVKASMRELAFVAETVGHLRNMPIAVEAADRARAILTKLEGTP